MTREEAIERMKIIKGDCYIIDNPKDKEAFDMSIFALEQEPYELLIIKSDILLHQEDRKKWIESIKREKENGVIILPPYFTPLLVPNDVEIRIEQPCEDAISREDVLKVASKECQEFRGIYGRIEDGIQKLPSVNPQPCDDAISRDDRLLDLANAIESDDSGYWTNKRISSALRNIEKLPSVTQKSGKWIPVSERLPEDLEPVNITWVNHEPEPYYHDIKDRNFVATGIYYRGQWYWYSTTCADYLGEYGSNEIDKVDDAVEIIAWMPLPKPYEPQESEG